MKKPSSAILPIAGAITGFILIFMALFFFNGSFREQVKKRLIYNVPMTYGTQFHDALASSTDRIVIRDGGHNRDDSDPVIADIRDKKVIDDFFKNIAFSAHTTSDSKSESCMCHGYPGLDFYNGNRLLAVTSVQHFKNLRWRGFSTLRFAGWTIHYGDAPMTPEARIWLKDFLKKYNVKVVDYSEGEGASSSNEATPGTTKPIE